MKEQSGLLLIIIIVISLLTGCEKKDLKSIKEDIYVEKTSDGYDLIFDYKTNDELRFIKVDSLAYSEGYSFLLFGKIEVKDRPKWYYISGAPKELKKCWGGWYDGEFRKYRLNEIDRNRKLYSKLKGTNDIWRNMSN